MKTRKVTNLIWLALTRNKKRQKNSSLSYCFTQRPQRAWVIRKRLNNSKRWWNFVSLKATKYSQIKRSNELTSELNKVTRPQ